MSNIDHSMSITPPSRMNVSERIGMTLAGIGLLAMIVAFIGTHLPPYIPMAFSMAGLISGAIVLSRKKRDHRLTVISLFVISGVAAVFTLLNWLEVFSMNKLFSSNLAMWILFGIIFGLTSIGGLIFFYNRFGKGVAGIRLNGMKHSEVTRKQGSIGWILTILFTGFYVMIYWFPDLLAGLVQVTDPFHYAMTGAHSVNAEGHVTNQWFFYGIIYTLLVIVMGFRFIWKYRHSRYQIIRTISVMFFQLILSFMLPNILARLNNTELADGKWTKLSEEYKTVYLDFNSTYWNLKSATDNGRQAEIDSLTPIFAGLETKVKGYQADVEATKPKWSSHSFTYFWPLAYANLQPDAIDTDLGGKDQFGYILPWSPGLGTWGWVLLGVGIFCSFVLVIVLTYFFGKRWYCSFVCGCGALAETAGDPFRHLSDKSTRAWRVERVLIHSVLALVTGITILLLINWKFEFMNEGLRDGMKKGYGFLIASVFSGVVGTGFYPILGSRVWCRFGCPQAAILGLIQKYFSRFRITTNGGQCISCGNCSTSCEMGIDVKAYAQRGENIVRASCVGCGVCSSVCPRGVLSLENGPKSNRTNGGGPISISKGEITVV